MRFVRLIEELSMTALPSLQTVYDDGWVLRFAEGYTRRANSVNPLYPSTQPIAEKIARCESLYHSRGLNTVFKLTSAAVPEDLELMLERCGYHEDGRTSIQVANLSALDASAIEPVRLSKGLTEGWLSAYCRLNGVDSHRIPLMTQMLGHIVPETAYALVEQDGEIVATGLGIADRGYIGLFDIVVDARLRNQGLGHRIVANLLAWGKSRGAQSAYLQAVLTNKPAHRLYAKFGFREIYQYWYRVKHLR
jgi:GNAT superfamily N-acetyltransferase